MINLRERINAIKNLRLWSGWDTLSIREQLENPSYIGYCSCGVWQRYNSDQECSACQENRDLEIVRNAFRK